MPESRKRMRPVHAAPAVDRTVPQPIGTRGVRNPVEPCLCCGYPFGRANANRRPPLSGTVMCHAAAYSRGGFSVRWDNGIWEAQLDVSYVTAVSEATVTPISRLPHKRAIGQ
ncbi:MAG: hypothetical protein ACRDTA_28010 [Pseudonocardiaceae bacterium]